MERMRVKNETEVIQFNEKNKELYEELTKLTGLPMNGPGDVASLYSTLKAETAMGLPLPEWTKEYFPDKLEKAVSFSLSMNVYDPELQMLAGGPLVKKTLNSMMAKAKGGLKPKDRKMYVYVGHDSTLADMLSAMQIWDYKDPDFGCMIMIELHEEDGNYNVQMDQKNSPTQAPYPLKVPRCEIKCPLDKFAQLMQPTIPGNYYEDCKVDDPNYVIPPSPPT